MAEAKRDQNYVTSLIAVSNVDGITPVVLWADPVTHRLLVSGSGGSGVNIEIPSGTVDGSNLTFTVTKEPKVVVIDGMARRSTKGYTYSLGTITVDSLTPPFYDIFTIY